MQLTEAGRVLADHLTIVFDQIDVAKGEISDLKKLKTGSVSVATVEGISDPFLSASITAFRKKFPAIDFRVRIRGRERVLEAVEQHLSQIGLSTTTSPIRRSRSWASGASPCWPWCRRDTRWWKATRSACRILCRWIA